MDTDAHIVVLGGPALDLLARVPYFPSIDGNVVATQLERQPGGVGANIAVGLANLGNKTILLGATGDDDIGDFLRERLQEAHVETEHMLRRAQHITQSCFIAIKPDGNRIIYALPGATTLEAAEELDHGIIQEARALHIAPAYRKVALAAIDTAKRHKLFISYTPADVYWPQGPGAVREIARLVDLLIINRIEAAGLTGINDPQRALKRLLEWGYSPIILTLGEKGVLVGEHTKCVAIPAYPVAGVQDTTGAGDSFAAGVISGILMGLPLTRAARLGTAVAALKIRQRGAQAGLPSLEEALDLAMQQVELKISDC